MTTNKMLEILIVRHGHSVANELGIFAGATDAPLSQIGNQQAELVSNYILQNYTTDGLSSAVLKNILSKNGVDYCDFYMRSDMPCGGTLGAISSSQLSINSVDVGIAQLAMHSAAETFALKDYETMTKGLTAFFNDNK